ncbi:MAG: hypothetical protein Ct9H300mP11_32740 [Chloroflexota bacterium]|nr:MAG: hypothetical protein Ct9H300mP11_32740 [Chloroflexota bacterium]
MSGASDFTDHFRTLVRGQHPNQELILEGAHMPEVYGTGDFRYNFVENWAKLPAGMSFKECPGVAVTQTTTYLC